MRKILFGSIAALCLMAGQRVQAAVIDMNFDTLQNNELVNSYYDGGYGSLGSGPGPNDGVTFSNAQVVNQGTSDAVLASPPNAITPVGAGPIVMNVAAGFTTAFSFNYASPSPDPTVTVWSGLNGSGTDLASFNLGYTSPGTGATCGGLSAPCTLETAEGTTFSGTAESVTFNGPAGLIFIDDITLGAATPGATSIPEPASIALVAAGLLGLGALRRGRRA